MHQVTDFQEAFERVNQALYRNFPDMAVWSISPLGGFVCHFVNIGDEKKLESVVEQEIAPFLIEKLPTEP